MTRTMLDYFQELGQAPSDCPDPLSLRRSQREVWDALTAGREVIVATKIVAVRCGVMMSYNTPNKVVYNVDGIYHEEARPHHGGGLYVYTGTYDETKSQIDQIAANELLYRQYEILDCLAAGPFQYYGRGGKYLGETAPGPRRYYDGIEVVTPGHKVACSALWVRGLYPWRSQ